MCLSATATFAAEGVTVVGVNEDEALFKAVSRGDADALACDSAVSCITWPSIQSSAPHSRWAIAPSSGSPSRFAHL